VDSGQGTSARPLTRRQSAWRYVLAVVLGLLSFWAAMQDQYVGAPLVLPVLDLLAGVVAVVLLRWRRSHPLAVGAVLNGLTALSGASAGPALLAMVSVATRRRWSEILPVSAVSVAASLVYFQVQTNGSSYLASVVLGAVSLAAVNAIGMYVGARRDLAASKVEQALQAERQQALQITEARVSERARIAREMHDVLAHRLSLVAMHAGALSYRRGLDEEQVAATADVIRASTHAALTDLREILGVLRADDQDAPPERPQPTLSDVPALVAEAVAAGSTVRLDVQVDDLSSAPDTVGRSAYRVVQEALTNARKHAPDTTVDVLLRGGPGDELLVEVRNPVRVGAVASRVDAATPGAGLGLVGLTERAELVGGLLEHGTRDGDFVVRARLPWPA
jgi:signal transduction histidine kinase